MTKDKVHPLVRMDLQSYARCLVVAGLTVTCIAYNPSVRAEDYSIIFSFYEYDHGHPETGVIQDLDGNLVGTLSGQPYVSLFKLTPPGITTFVGPIQGAQGGGLSLAENGTIYGTFDSYFYENNELGSDRVIKVPPSFRRLTTLHDFSFDASPRPETPCGKLAVDAKNNVFGTTEESDKSFGVVFKIAHDGSMQVLHKFLKDNQGDDPYCSAIALDPSGSLFGTFARGGLRGHGGVFKIDSNNRYTVVHSFEKIEGSRPSYGVILDKDGNIFGNTQYGGANNKGTIFKIAPDGTTTTIFSFGGAQSGRPHGGLVRDAEGNFYGTADGGLHGCGSVYKVTLSGQGFTLHDFCATSGDGRDPSGRLTLDKRYLYGTTRDGGAHSYGTVFKIAK